MQRRIVGNFLSAPKAPKTPRRGGRSSAQGQPAESGRSPGPARTRESALKGRHNRAPWPQRSEPQQAVPLCRPCRAEALGAPVPRVPLGGSASARQASSLHPGLRTGRPFGAHCGSPNSLQWHMCDQESTRVHRRSRGEGCSAELLLPCVVVQASCLHRRRACRLEACTTSRCNISALHPWQSTRVTPGRTVRPPETPRTCGTHVMS